MARVYVVQSPAVKDHSTGTWTEKFDLTPAAHFGDLVFLLPRGNVPNDLDETLATLRKGLEMYTPSDYLLLLGDPVAIALAAVVASNVSRERLRFLKWDRRQQCYRPSSTRI